MSQNEWWDRATSNNPCPICKKPDWCLIAKDKSAVICPRIVATDQDGKEKYVDGSGWLHVLKETTNPKAVQSYRFELPHHNQIMADIAKKYRKLATDKQVATLGDLLGVSAEALHALWIGYSRSKKAFTFPMFRKGYEVLGIRVRRSNGNKFSEKGSKEGLFIPKGFSDDSRPVLVCEGPTDTACCVDLDFRAVGRPSCLGGGKLLKELLDNEHVCILADSDGPGQTGAQKLAELLTNAKSVSVATPPTKDLREWKNQGCTRQDLLKLIRGTASSLDTTSLTPTN